MTEKMFSSGEFQQLLECPVCLTKYSLPTRTPKILGCGHTFCVSCLDTLVKDAKISCPTCRTTAGLPANGIRSLVSNHHVISMLETLCVICGDQLKQQSCPHCDKVLCLPCINSHALKLAADTKHTVNKLAAVIVDISPDGEVETEVDKVKSEYLAIRNGILSNFEAENKKFMEEHKTAKQSFLDDQKIKLQQHLEEIEKLEKQKIQTLIMNEKSKSEISCQWYYNKDGWNNVLDGKDLSMEKILTTVTEVERLQKQANLVTKCDLDKDAAYVQLNESSMDSTNPQKEVHLYPALDPRFAALNKYKRLKLPQFIISGISSTVIKQGYWNVCVSPEDGTIYIADNGAKSLVHLSESGQHLGILGERSNPTIGVAVNHAGQVAVTGTEDTFITYFDSNHKKISRSFGVKAQPDHLSASTDEYAGTFTSPWGLHYGYDDNLYVTDLDNKMVHVRSADGKWHVHSVFSQVVSCTAVLPNGTLLVGTRGTDPQLWRVDPDGSKYQINLPSPDTSGKTNNGFHQLCVDETGFILIAHGGRNCILVVDINGRIHHTIGQRGWQPGEFQCPAGVAITRNGRIVVTEYFNRRIQIF